MSCTKFAAAACCAVVNVCSAFGETSSGGSEARRCSDAIDVLKLVVQRHYRPINSLNELVDRVNRALLASPEFLERPGGSDLKGVRLITTLNRLASIGDNDRLLINCHLPTVMADIAGPGLDPIDIWDSTLNAFLSEMDPHSQILSPYKVGQDAVRGKRVGLGVLYQIQNDGRIRITDVLNGSSAQVAGLRAGDRIRFVNKPKERFDLTQLKSEGILRAITGLPGEEIEFEVQRVDGSLQSVCVPLKPFSVTFLASMRLPGNVLYLNLSQFGVGAAAEIREALNRHSKVIGIILDLRFNPGGLMTEAAKVVDLFVDRGIVASAWDRFGHVVAVAKAVEAGVMTTVPLVILVNDLTASAAEMVAQALSRSGFGRAVIVGRPTYGKGSAQRVHLITEGRQLLLTEAIYFTAGGGSPQKTGVIPDLTVFDPFMDRILKKRGGIDILGVKLKPLREAEEPFALAAPGPMSDEKKAVVGSIAASNPLEKLLPLMSTRIGLPDSYTSIDPEIRVSVGILRNLSARGSSYAASLRP